ncbi:MAG: hypothetical protein ACRYG8_16805 [Janthinobacterium lividum]
MRDKFCSTEAAVADMAVSLSLSWVVGPDVEAGRLKRLAITGEAWNVRMSGIHVLRPPAAALRSHVGSPPISDQGLLPSLIPVEA